MQTLAVYNYLSQELRIQTGDSWSRLQGVTA